MTFLPRIRPGDNWQHYASKAIELANLCHDYLLYRHYRKGFDFDHISILKADEQGVYINIWKFLGPNWGLVGEYLVPYSWIDDPRAFKAIEDYEREQKEKAKKEAEKKRVVEKSERRKKEKIRQDLEKLEKLLKRYPDYLNGNVSQE